MNHVALMGDPTLRLHVVAPPRELTVKASAYGVQLQWQPSADKPVDGYLLYRAQSSAGPFTRLTSRPIQGLTFIDVNASSDAVYMVRAVKTQHTVNGSYPNISQGCFAAGAMFHFK